MNENDKLSRLRDNLIAQDLPPPGLLSAHQEILFKKAKRRLFMEKGLVGLTYVAVFAAAFLSFLKGGRVQDAMKALWWTAGSMHLLLWFLVFFLWRVERLIRRIRPSAKHVKQTKLQNRTVFICALAAWALGTGFLCASSLLRDPLKAVQVSRFILWAPVFFLFWYPFGIATAVGRLWLLFKEVEIPSGASEKAERGRAGSNAVPAEDKPEESSL